MNMSITKIDESNYHLIPQKMELDCIGKVKLYFDGATWTYKECLDAQCTKTHFPTSKPQCMSELDESRYGYIITDNANYVGHVIFEKRYNNMLYIEDFDVSPQYRQKGMAIKLMDKVVAESKELLLGGISLEVQHTNLIAFRFYMKYGFSIGGYDNHYYNKTRQNEEHAVYLYLYNE